MEKKMDTVRLQDQLTGALIGLVRAMEGNEHLVTKETTKFIVEGLYATISSAKFSDKEIESLIEKVHKEKHRLVPDCSVCASPCGRTADYDMRHLWNAKEDIRSLKSVILMGIREMSACVYHAESFGYSDETINDFFNKALFTIGMDYDKDDLLPVILEMGEVNLKCMELLDKANAEI